MKAHVCLGMLVFLSLPAFATVTVTRPASGQIQNSSVSYAATATTSTCSKGVASMGVYVDNVLIYVVQGASLNSTISIHPGPHHTVVEEWDFCGGATYTPVDITVAGVAVTSPLPGASVTSPVTYSATAATTESICSGESVSPGRIGLKRKPPTKAPITPKTISPMRP